MKYVLVRYATAITGCQVLALIYDVPQGPVFLISVAGQTVVEIILAFNSRKDNRE